MLVREFGPHYRPSQAKTDLTDGAALVAAILLRRGIDIRLIDAALDDASAIIALAVDERPERVRIRLEDAAVSVLVEAVAP